MNMKLGDQEKEVINNLYVEMLTGKITEVEYLQEKARILKMVEDGEDIFI